MCRAAVNVGPSGGLTRIQAELLAVQLGSVGPVPTCPADGSAGSTRAEAERRLPTAHPRADPGKAHTGLPVYLEFGLPKDPIVETLDLPSRPVLNASITRWEVQWVPGGSWEQVDGPGVPYERRAEGWAVTHQYPRPGTEPCDESARTAPRSPCASPGDSS